MMALYAWVDDIGLRLARAGYWMVCHRMQFAGARVLRAGHRMMRWGFVGLRRRA